MDLLVVEAGIYKPQPDIGKIPLTDWGHLVKIADDKPLIILETWNTCCITWENGPTGTATEVYWVSLGYRSTYRLITGTNIGEAVWQMRLMVAWVLAGSDTVWICNRVLQGHIHTQ